MRKAAIISTGSELLHGSVVDTNAAFICAKLFPTRIAVMSILTVGDAPEDILRAIRSALDGGADVVFMTGGLGPTEDDYTTEVVCALTGDSPLIHEPSMERVRAFFASLNATPNPGDVKMVTVPSRAEVFANDVGLAAGYAVSAGDGVLVAMPGVPREMTAMFERHVMPWLGRAYGVAVREHAVFRTMLMRESEVNTKIMGMGVPLDRLEWGISTTVGMNTVTFVAREEGDFPADAVMGEARRVFGNRLLEGNSPEEEVLDLLFARNLTLAAAESCTGGIVSKRLTDIAGSSRSFLGCAVTYSNESKTRLLAVGPGVIGTHGAVSEEVAAAMARGARAAFGADIGVSTTGSAGPGGGSESKPVGTVCFGLSADGTGEAFTRRIPGDRERVRFYSSQIILDRLRVYLRGLA
jgi:nicotinamide-nucleotide amidase